MKRSIVLYLLAFGAFMVAVAELVVAGILTAIAADMQISVAAAGQLITGYSLAFAIGTPILTAVTARYNRKGVLLVSLVVFILGSLLSALSSTFVVLMASRVVLGLSGGVFSVAAMSSVAKLVPPQATGRAMSLIALGFSLAFVLGVPIGIALAERYDWHAIFLLLAVAALLVWLGLAQLLPPIAGDVRVKEGSSYRSLARPSLLFALVLSLMWSTGNSVQFTFIRPYLASALELSAGGISLVMVAFGLFGVLGSRLGGYGADRWGTGKLLTFALAVGIVSFALMPLLSGVHLLGLLLLLLWVTSMFAGAPGLNAYFIQQAPHSANLLLSLNMTFTHTGLALGAGAGGVLLELADTPLYHPWLAGASLLIAWVAGLVAFARTRRPLRGKMHVIETES